LGAGPALFEDVSVSGNNLAMTGLGATDAISWNSVASSIDNVRIDDNVITNAVDGIDLSAVGSGSPAINTALSNFSVRGNKIVASGRGFVGNVTGHVGLWEASENTVEASGGVFALAPTATAPAVTASSFLSFSRNKFTALAGANTRLQFSDMKVNGLRFEGNTLVGGDVASVGGLQVLVSGSSSGLLPAVRNLHIFGNTFRNMDCAGIALSVLGPTDPVVDTVVSNNTFEVVATDVATLRASVFRCDVNTIVRNMKVCDNQVVGSGHSSTTHGGFDFTLAGSSGLDVSGNQFNASTGVSATTYGNFLYLEASASPSDLKDVKVCRNQVRGVEVPSTGTSTSLALISLDLQNFTTVENLSVCDNDLDRVDNGTGDTYGVYLQTINAFARFSCDRNRVTGVGSDVAAFYLDLGGASEVSVSGNYVTGDSSTGASGEGIRLNFAGTGSKVRVCGNDLTGDLTVPATEGIFVDGGSNTLTDLRVDSNTILTYRNPVTIVCNDLANLSFSDNQALGFTVSSFLLNPRAAFRIVVTGVSQRLEFSNNKCQSTANDVRGWLLEIGDTNIGDSCAGLVFSHNMVTLSGTPSQALRIQTQGASFKNFVFTGNVFRGSSSGIAYSNAGGSAPDQCTFMGNIGDSAAASSWSQFAVGGGAGWTNVLPNPIATFQAFNIDDGT
jgi:hypothetical protein